jgi:hypothetical protein
MEEIRVRTYAAYLRVVVCLYDNADGVGPLFRGQSNQKWPLVPAFGRNGKTVKDVTQPNADARQPAALELELFELFKLQSASRVPGIPNALELLSIAQHHGCPTRLLDWTTNASVGLWFALADKQTTDAAVWTLDPPEWGLVQSYTIHGVVTEESLQFIRFPHRSPRAIVQGSCYSFHPYRKVPGDHWTRPLDEHEWYRTKLLKIVIPGGARKSILETLERAGITAQSLTLDLPGLGRDLADLYNSHAGSITLRSSPTNA